MAAQQVIVIGQETSDSYPACVFVDTISERNALVTNKIVIVRNAYKSDASVNKGWAAYVLDPKNKTWAKIIEQESVDGPWGVNEEIKKSLVTKAQFEALQEAVKKTDPDHLITDVDWTKEPGKGGIKNRPNIEAVAVNPETGAPTEWIANIDHVKVGDIKKLQILGGHTTFTAALARLNQLSYILGASASEPTGTKSVTMKIAGPGGTEVTITPGGKFREARVGFSDAAQKRSILVIGGNQSSGDYAGLWWTEDGTTLHRSNVTAGDWEQPVYSRRLKKWVAASGTQMTSGVRGIAFSSDGKTWVQTNMVNAQTEVDLYEDDDTTLFMCGHSISSNGESWSAAKVNGGSAIVSSIGDGCQAAPITIKGQGKYLYIVSPASFNQNNVRHTIMCACVSAGAVYNNGSTVTWYDVTSSDGSITRDTSFDSIQHMTVLDGGKKVELLFAPSTNKNAAYYMKLETELTWNQAITAKMNLAIAPIGTHTYETPALCGNVIVLPTMAAEATGDGIFATTVNSFLAAINAGKVPEWTHVTTASNGGAIHKGGYYKPEPVHIPLNGNDVTVYCTTGYKFGALMLFSLDGINWYKSEYSVHSKPPFQFGDHLIFPVSDGSGAKYLTTAEFAESVALSMGTIKPDTLTKLGDEWTEKEMVTKINQLITGFNAMASLIGLKVQ